MILGDDVQQLFEAIFRAKRNVAARAEDLRAAEAVVETRRDELERAQEQLADLEQRLSAHADRAAGVARRVGDDSPTEKPLAGYRPIARH